MLLFGLMQCHIFCRVDPRYCVVEYGIIWHSFCHEHENVISAKHLMLRILTASSSPTDANMIYIYIYRTIYIVLFFA